MKASDIMTFGTATVSASAPLTRAIRIMTDHRISALPVLDATGRVQGIISESDFFRRGEDKIDFVPLLDLSVAQRLEGLEARKVAELMTSGGTAVGPDASIEDVAATMRDHDLRHLPVIENGHAVGMISRIDVLRLLAGAIDTHHSN